MGHMCDDCGEEFQTLSKLRLHECESVSVDGDLTVLDDYTVDGQSHREVARELLPQLREEMPEEEYEVEFHTDLQSAVIDSITRDLEANLLGDDWYGMGFKEPEDFLDAGAVSKTIGERAEWYFEHDQIGKSWDVLRVILEYAEEYDLVERQE